MRRVDEVIETELNLAAAKQLSGAVLHGDLLFVNIAATHTNEHNSNSKRTRGRCRAAAWCSCHDSLSVWPSPA